MAMVGFYDIRTFECLSREMTNNVFSYASIKADAPHVGGTGDVQAGSEEPAIYKAKDK